jgi:hypothetical protein
VAFTDGGEIMTKTMRITLGLTLAAAIGCKSAPPVAQQQFTPLPECRGPAWTCFKSGPCPFPDLPESLCAVGTADQVASYNLGVQTASTRARVEMGAVVKSQVSGFTRAVQDSASKAGAGEESVQKIGDLAQNVVEVSMSGVSVPKTWFDPELKIYFALAVIDAKTFGKALKGLKENAALSESVKAEIDARAESVVNEWKSETGRAPAALQ